MTNLNIPAPPSGQRPVDTYQWLGKILEVLGTTKGISWYDNNALNIKQLGDAIGNDINFSKTVDKKIADSHLPVQIPAYCDLDTYTETGLYTSDSDGNSATITNRPPGTQGFILQVYTVWGTVTKRVIQVAYMRSDAMIYTRSKDDSDIWREWTRQLTTSDMTSANTANKVVQRDASGNFSAGTITASLSGNAKTATTLQTTRNINGTPFNGSGDITTVNWGTSRNITIGNSTKPVNGSTNVTWTLSEIGAANASHTHTSAQISDATSSNTANMIVKRDASGNFSAGTITAALAGNASTATKLATARSINGTKFDGSGDITTANWGTSRNITIGNSTKPVNGSVNVGWSLSEIGALPLTGGTVTGPIIKSGIGAGFAISNGTSRTMMYSSQTAGEHIFGGSNNSSLEVTDYIRIGANKLSYQTGGSVYNIYHEGNKPTSEHISDATSANTANKIVKRDASGNFSAGTITASLSGNAKTATTLQTARNINGTSFNGSGDITTAKWGTARTIELSGDMTGSVSVDGSKNATIAARRRHCICGQTTTADTTNCYFKVASFSTTADYTDARISFYVSSDYGSTDGGILHALCRRGNGASTIDLRTLVWDYAYGISANDFQLLSVTSGSTTTFELWVKVASAHKCYRFNVIDEGNRSNSNNVWTLYDSKNTSSSTGGKSAVTSGGTVSNSTFASILNNSASATKLATARSINGTKFDGSTDITTANWGTSRTITIGNTGKPVNGAGNVTWTLSEIGAAAASHTHTSTQISDATSSNTANMIVKRDSSGNISVGTVVGALSGNASTATKLITARSINGTKFDGSTDITTSNWGTTRTLTIGNSGKSVNGSANVSWSLTEIGASPVENGVQRWNSTIKCATWSRILYLSGNTIIGHSGIMNIQGTRGGVVFNVTLLITASHSFNVSIAQLNNTKYSNLQIRGIVNSDGAVYIEVYDNANSATNATLQTLNISYINLSATGIGTITKYTSFTDGTTIPSGFTEAHKITTVNGNNYVGNASTATTLQTARTINGTSFNGAANITTANWGTARNITIGNTTKSVNGSINVGWNLNEIGAAAASHTHTSAQISDATNANTANMIVKRDGSGNFSAGTISASLNGTATYANYMSRNTRMEYGWDGVNYFNISGTAGNAAKVNDTPTTSWWHIMRFNHANSAGFYTDLAIPFNDVSLHYKRVSTGAVQNGGWIKVLDSLNYTSFVPTKTGSGASGTWGISVSGNASTATTLQTARTINGTSFNGSANITTANWGTARTITIGNSGKSVNGSGNVSWSLSEIGAAPISHEQDFSGTGTDTFIAYPKNGRIRTSTSLSTGYLKITLPVSWSSTMIRFTVSIFDYSTNSTFDIVVGGYNYADGSTWINTSAYIISSKDCVHKNLAVRFGHDGSKCAIYIGESTTRWQYLQITVHSITAGFQNTQLSKWNSGWGIGVTTTLGTIQSTITNPYVGNGGAAATLQTARTINGTSFNGSANITTANWGTARTLTIGSTGKSVNGSANVSWSLSEIGAVPVATGSSITIHADSDASSTGEYLLLKAGHNELKIASSAGGTTSTKGSDKITFNGYQVYHAGKKPTASEIGAAAASHTHSYLPLSGGTITGTLTARNAGFTTVNDTSHSVYSATGDHIFISNEKARTYLQMYNDGRFLFSGHKIYHAGNKPTPSEIGAAAASHTHSYLPLSGGTITGTLTARNAGFTTVNDTSHSVYSATGDHIFISNEKARTYLQMYNDGRFLFSGHKIYHAGNKPTPSEIGAAAASHTHSYLPLSGGTITGTLTGKEIYCTGINGAGGANLWLTGPTIYIQGHALPSPSAAKDLGNSSNRWRAVYAANGTIQTSDERFKDDIIDIDDELFFEMVKGVSVNTYVMRQTPKDSNVRNASIELYTQENAPSERVHVGIIAQEMAEFEAGKYILVKESEDDYYSVNNYNFTSGVMAALKVEISKREELEKKNESLEERVAKLESLIEKLLLEK